MDNNNPQTIDPAPKRRKAKDNPYSIFSVGSSTEYPHYYVSFIDGQGIRVCIEISRQLYELFDRFELEDLSYLNEWDRHMDLRSVDNERLNRRSGRVQESVEDMIYRKIRNENLYTAIQKLPPVQRRRLVLYYFGGFTYEAIAKMENSFAPVIYNSVSSAKRKLKKYLMKE